ncbi:hypothetical protein SASPL_142346 [Salvia splendens]|uniref:Zinc-finger domain-containing protein n=1 Tax=Salvia splendens TaxID=180675 RepID=A0A8X8WJR3_SALSN|nr:hypothetical protein SASPL_142346 [Salvia splendens]
MVARRSSPPEILEIPESERMQQCESVEEDDVCGSGISDYELCREERIRENRERMQKLGIFPLSLSQKLNSPKSTPVRACRKVSRLHSPPSVGPTRRSSRQKTLGQHTHCSNCNMIQGQFCGDCLYMRYGENVLEANANPDWICPVCRGICNCSLCRHAKGWPPTGILCKKSVAHYLIQTRRAQTNKENNVVSKVPVSAKRSLPFSNIEVTGEDSDLTKPSHECSNPNSVSISDKESTDCKLAPECGDKPLPYPADDALTKDQVEHPLKPKVGKDSPEFDDDKESIHVACTVCVNVIDVETEPLNDEVIVEVLERGGDDAYEIEKEESVPDIKCGIESATSPKSTKKRVGYEPTPDSIGRRLRMRRTGPKLASASHRGPKLALKMHPQQQMWEVLVVD